MRQALDVLQQLKFVNGAALAVLRDAKAAGDGELTLRAIDRVLTSQIELQAKLLGDLDDRPQVSAGGLAGMARPARAGSWRRCAPIPTRRLPWPRCSVLLADDLACALDPVALAHQVGLVPDDWQARMLRSASRAIILNCSRQAGKSAASALLAAHTGLYEAGSLSIVLGPSERQAIELLRTARAMLAALGEDAPELATDNTLSCNWGTARACWRCRAGCHGAGLFGRAVAGRGRGVPGARSALPRVRPMLAVPAAGWCCSRLRSASGDSSTASGPRARAGIATP